jgi:UDP-glucose:(heptosyl)LPS alpha-1,3-glucosyltransferase
MLRSPIGGRKMPGAESIKSLFARNLQNAEGVGRQFALSLDQSNIAPTQAASPVRFRLAFAIQRYFRFGGLQRDLLRVALACCERGHEVHILAAAWEGPQPADVRVHLLPARGWTNHRRSRSFARAVRRYVRRERFDCLIGFNKMPGLDVYWAGDLCLAERLRHRKSRLLSWLPRYRTYLELEAAVMGHKGDTEVLVLAERERKRIVRNYRTAESRLHLMPPGIDKERFAGCPAMGSSSAAFRAELGIEPTDLMILTVGSSFRRKGVDRGIRAVASLPECRRRQIKFVVVGSDHPRPFQRLAKWLNVSNQVIFAGGREEVADFYRSADLLLHPARTETTGNTLLEALTCGLPVLATQDCGYAVHVRRANAGLICRMPFAQSRLNGLLAEMLSAESRATWRGNALEYCRRMDLNGLLVRTVEIIRSRAERNRRAGFAQA